MNYIFSIFIILISVFLLINFLSKRRLNTLKKTINENWGRQKNNEYFNFDLISKYFDYSTRNKNNFYQIISDKTSNDLDINSLFKFIDRTSSKIGQQYLYYKLRTPKANINALIEFDKLVELFSNDPKSRIACQIELSKLNSNNAYYLEELLHREQIIKPKNLKFTYVLSFAMLIGICSAFIYPIALLILLPAFVTNMFIHYRNKQNINYYLIAVTEFLKSTAVAKNISNNNLIKNHFNDLSFLDKISNFNLKTQLIGFEKQMDNEFAVIMWIIFEFIKITFNLEVIIFFGFIDSITKEKESINKLFDFLGEIDAAISTDSLRQGTEQYSKPNFVKNKKLYCNSITHPLIQDCVSNNLDMENNSILLTGSNMSGKTTFIRTIALNAILSQTLYTCFAKEYIASFFKIYSSIRISDDLLEGTSYYLQEVLTIKEFIKESHKQENCLFVLDEIFKGTNTLERISGGKAILSYLNKNGHFVFVSTHDIELTELLSRENYSLFHFEEHIENNELIFDYMLKEGALKTRNAIKILEMYDYPNQIISDANDTLNKI